MTINVGVIGLGMGRHHAKQYEASPLANLVALCDTDERRLEEYRALYPRAKTYSSCEDMFAAGGLDAASIALPNYLHDTVTIAALGAGLHVLCEKPMALNAPRAEAMLEAARAAGKQLMIHFNYRYQPACSGSRRTRGWVACADCWLQASSVLAAAGSAKEFRRPVTRRTPAGPGAVADGYPRRSSA